MLRKWLQDEQLFNWDIRVSFYPVTCLQLNRTALNLIGLSEVAFLFEVTVNLRFLNCNIFSDFDWRF